MADTDRFRDATLHERYLLKFADGTSQRDIRRAAAVLSALFDRRQKPKLCDFGVDYGNFEGAGAVIHIVWRKPATYKTIYGNMVRFLEGVDVGWDVEPHRQQADTHSALGAPTPPEVAQEPWALPVDLLPFKVLNELEAKRVGEQRYETGNFYPLEEPPRGAGTHGIVRASKRGDSAVVVKALKGASANAVLHEVQLLVVLRRLPNIVELLDVYLTGEVWNLVFRDAGVDAAKLLADRGGDVRDRSLPLFAQAALAVAAVHGRGIVHADVKPANLLVDTSCWRVRLADFGFSFHLGTPGPSAMYGTPEYAPPEALDTHPRQCPTQGADTWALGCLLFEFVFTRRLAQKIAVRFQPAQLLALAAKQAGRLRVQNAAAGQVAATLLVNLAERGSAGEAGRAIESLSSDSATLELRPYAHGGEVVMRGHKGNFVFSEGRLSDELLRWLDEDLQLLGDAGLQWHGTPSQPDRKNEGGVKVQVGGNAGLPTLANQVNGISNEKLAILPRYASFVRAFNHANREVLQKRFHEPLREALSAPELESCENSQELRAQLTPAKYLFGALSNACQSQRFGPLRMSTHGDGSGGMMLMGIQSGAGARELHIQLEDGTILIKELGPGHIYVSSIAAALHQVVHPAIVPGITIQGLPGCAEVATIVRCTWFGRHRSRGSQGLEGRAFFEPSMKAINNFLSTNHLRTAIMVSEQQGK